MMIRLLLLLLTTGLIFLSCQNKTVNTGFEEILNPDPIQQETKQINSEIDFWRSKLYIDSGNFVYMQELAKQHLRLFHLTGNITSLQLGDSLLKRSAEKLNFSDPEILYSLAQNSITQHRFKDAADYIATAEKNAGDPYILHLLRFDVLMERGNYAEAYKNLRVLKDKTSFDYLIRLAKWEDHKGRIEQAIQLMEEALVKVKDRNQPLYLWALSNLADMYGHAGRIKDAYQAYREVLRMQPANFYCLKGLAWIAYAQNNNMEEAKRILYYIQQYISMPEVKLILAEIAEMCNQPDEANMLTNEFVSLVSKKEYGDMYNKYLIEIWSNDKWQRHKALAIALGELENRFTPETCEWVARVYYRMGNNREAMKWISSYVLGQSFEPETQMNAAIILAVHGKKQQAKQLLDNCLESSFELGPAATQRIKKLLLTL